MTERSEVPVTVGGPVSGSFGRRRFLALAGTGVVVVAVAGCRSNSSGTAPRGSSTTTAASSAGSSPASTGPATSPAAAAGTGGAGERILVLVQLNGGNDGLNTLVPADGRYRDARPSLAVAEEELVALPGESGYSLHPSLAPLVPLWQANRLSFVESIGFPDPDRSHFVAMDTWWRAGDLTAPTGWLGRVLDHLPTDPDPLYATALAAGAPLLLGTRRQPTVVLRPASFDFAKGIRPELLARLADPLADTTTIRAPTSPVTIWAAVARPSARLAPPSRAGGSVSPASAAPAGAGSARSPKALTAATARAVAPCAAATSGSSARGSAMRARSSGRTPLAKSNEAGRSTTVG